MQPGSPSDTPTVSIDYSEGTPVSDYHVHYHVNVLNIPGADNEALIKDAVFPHVVTSAKSEAKQQLQPDGATTFIWTESTMNVEKARELALENPDIPIILLTYGHDEGYEERSALVLHGENARYEITTTNIGKSEDIIDMAMREEDFANGQAL